MIKKALEKYKADIYRSCPYLKAGENLWIDANGDGHYIRNEFEFDDGYLLRAYGTLKKEYKNLQFNRDDYNTQLDDIKEIFEDKIEELYDEMKRRKIEHRFKEW